MKVYYDNDASLTLLEDKKIAVLGFGSQGHAHSLNLKESGLNVCVGLRKDSARWEKAVNAGLEVKTVSEAVKWGDVVMILLPDQVQKEVYDKEIGPYLKPETTLAFAKGIGGTRAGVIETNFKDETETDLFGEQAVLCGGSAELIKAGFETLVNAGYPPELAYFECMHEMKLIVDLYYEGGLSRMNYSVSDTAEYGGMTRGKKVINDESRKAMKQILADVQSGKFADEWLKEYYS